MSQSNDKYYLWPEGAPGALGSDDSDQPWFSIHLPESKSITSAVVICPGGGYAGLAFQHEGIDCAAFLNGLGVAAFVLRYRLGPRYHHPVQLGDAQRAVRTVRHRANEWGIDPRRIGIWGFSAGGHLASTVSTHFDKGDPSAEDTVDRESCRPDFSILGYPVISLQEPYAHVGSRTNLLGEDADPGLVENLSNHLQVTPETPPAFLVHTNGDSAVPAENSVYYYLALRKAGVPAEMHIFQNGRHGLGLAPEEPAMSKWPELLKNWLVVRGLVTKA
jgi:acetyl esterase/lipase